MASSTVRVGRMILREDDFVSESIDAAGNRTLGFSGQESIPRLTAIQVERQREDLFGMNGKFVQVVFDTKTYLDGFYRVTAANGSIEDWNHGMKVFPWSLTLDRIGTESEIDIESRLSGSVTRQNNFAVTGERVHAPAIGHIAYWSDATVSGAVSRVSVDGAITVYRGIGSTISPRWMVSPANYLKGRVRFLDDEGLERSGTYVNCSASDWELNNGLIRVRPLAVGGAIEIASWSGSAWQGKNWDLRAGIGSLAPFDQCSLIQNEFEEVTIRLMKSLLIGRVYVDIKLRRGYRFADVYIQSELGSTLKIVRGVAEAGSSATAGMVVASENDADGNKYVVGSAKTFSADIVNG